METISRKDFLVKCSQTCAGILAGGIFLSACKTAALVPFQIKDSSIVVKKADMVGKSSAIFRTDKLPAPVYLSEKDGNYEAVLMLCTHKDCELNTYGKVLHCPCHGSEFNESGEVLQGPAEKPLLKFKVIVDNENIYIQ